LGRVNRASSPSPRRSAAVSHHALGDQRLDLSVCFHHLCRRPCRHPTVLLLCPRLSLTRFSLSPWCVCCAPSFRSHRASPSNIYIYRLDFLVIPSILTSFSLSLFTDFLVYHFSTSLPSSTRRPLRLSKTSLIVVDSKDSFNHPTKWPLVSERPKWPTLPTMRKGTRPSRG
jgi:hypothetical protein